MRRKTPLGLLWVLFAFITMSSLYSLSQATPNLVTQKINEANVVPLKGSIHPLAKPEYDQGALSDNMPLGHVILLLNRSQQQQQALDAVFDQLHDPKSPTYHQWLTADEFGQTYGLSDSDLSAVVGWLQSKGFQIEEVTAGRTHIIFTGTVGQLRQAFNVDIHKFNVNGEVRYSNVNIPSAPAALAPALIGFRQLNNFPAHTNMTPGGLVQKDGKTGKLTHVSGPLSAPQITFSYNGSTFYDVSPQDFYTIYDENALLSQGINGAGITIAVIEETGLANQSDITNFRSQFGLPAYPSPPNNTQGGFNYMNGNAGGSPACSAAPSPTSTGEEGEALLDAEWAGAVAPNAIIDFVACNTIANAIGSFGTDVAATYIANHLYTTVSATSLSYGVCETSAGSTGKTFYTNLWQQMAAEGITPVVSAGDAGSAGCDQNASSETHNISTNSMSSTAYNISAGGTDFSDFFQTASNSGYTPYWNSSNSASFESAKSYVPEITWGGECSSPLFTEYLKKIGNTTFGSTYTPIAVCNSSAAGTNGIRAVVGGGGGVSQFNAYPTWQSVYGVGLNNVSTSFRNEPDLSFFASSGWWGHALLYCQSDAGATCTYSNGQEAFLLSAGGTSFVAPQINGLMALVNQKTGARQGQANYTLYNLASQEYGTTGSPNNSGLATCSGSGLGAGVGSSCTFRDIANDTPDPNGGTATSDIAQACRWSSVQTCWRSASQTFGISSVGNHPASFNDAYASARGYDLGTGLGSVDILNLVNNWNTVSPGFTSSTTISANPTTIGSGGSTQLTGTVTATQRGGVPSGTVQFYINSTSGTNLGSAPLAANACTGSAPSIVCTASANLAVQGSAMPCGANNLIAYFPGDGANDAPSTSTAVVVTNNNNCQQSQTITFPNPGTQTYGVAPITLTATASSGLAVTYSVISGLATVAGNVLTITGAGSVTVEANQAGNSQWLAAPPVDDTFTVNKAVLTVTANNASMVYGSTLPAFSATYSGFVNGDGQGVVSGSPSLTTTATSSSPVGSYPINAAQGTLSAANYTFSFVNGTLTITPAVLTVTANNATITEGSQLPTFTASYSGFVNGDGQGVLSGSPSLTTTAPQNPPVGTYPIIVAQGTLSAQNYTFTFVNGTLTVTAAVAQITSPPKNSTLSGKTATFTWSHETGATSYQLWLGHSAGTHDIASVGTSGLAATIGNLPTDGSQIYATLYGFANNSWTAQDTAVYTAATIVNAQITSPPKNSTLSGSSVTFTWTAETGATSYQVWVGHTAGTHDIGVVGTSGLAATVSGLPMDGSQIYVTLYGFAGAIWSVQDTATYTAGTMAHITSPPKNSTLSGKTVTFTWSAETGATSYQLWVGTAPGTHDIAVVGTSGLAATVGNLPTNGSQIYVTLNGYAGGVWTVQDTATYTAATIANAQITSPPKNSTLSGGTVTFTWTAETGATSYQIWIGNSPGAHDIASAGTAGLALTFSNLPTDGRQLYVTLYGFAGGVWTVQDTATYTAASH